jgi:hypothetical protein
VEDQDGSVGMEYDFTFDLAVAAASTVATFLAGLGEPATKEGSARGKPAAAV